MGVWNKKSVKFFHNSIRMSFVGLGWGGGVLQSDSNTKCINILLILKLTNLKWLHFVVTGRWFSGQSACPKNVRSWVQKAGIATNNACHILVEYYNLGGGGDKHKHCGKESTTVSSTIKYASRVVTQGTNVQALQLKSITPVNSIAGRV